MTVAPKLQKGLKRIFSSTVLQIIAEVLMVIGLIITLVGFAAALSDDALSEGGLVAAGGGTIIMAIAAILIVIAFILELVGTINVSHENGKFKTALYATLIALIVSVISGIVNANNNSTLSTIFTLVMNICHVLSFLFVLQGIAELGEKLNRDDILGRYQTLLITYVIAIVLMFVGGLIGANTIGYILQILGAICSLVAFFMYMGYLRKAIHALDGVPTAEQ